MQCQSFRWLGMSLKCGIGNSMGRHKTGLASRRRSQKLDRSVLTLRNPRHEKFVQELAIGKSADAAYVAAGYRANRSNAARLSANQDIQKRVVEIQSMGAQR